MPKLKLIMVKTDKDLEKVEKTANEGFVITTAFAHPEATIFALVPEPKPEVKEPEQGMAPQVREK